tara:strand:+ start:327 stop:2513 length:2187 start_codon:yes stop_codon:yes gene_type:complete
MLNNILKKITSSNSKYPSGYIEIVKCLDEESKTEKNLSLVWKAYQLSQESHKNQFRKSGEPYFTHCESVGRILANWNIDVETIVAGLLHDVIEDTSITKEDISKEFNKDIGNLVEGVTKLSGIKFNSKKQEQAENFMKMFISMAKDIRVILIKFADRLHNMSTIEHLSESKRKRIALETKEVYAPLAHRLGMNNVKTQMEDLVFKTLSPEKYGFVRKKVNNTRKDREKFIEKFITPIAKELKNFDINADIFGRAKHYSSIIGKMEKRNKKFEEIYDLFAIRIIVDKVDECYAALGVIHQNYNPFQERFKDYIARPKRNGYQSIHTTVFDLDGRLIEVQIRTSEMDQTAEIGVAAHWKYKENDKSKNKSSIDTQILWLREIYELLKSEDTSASEILELFKIDLFEDEIFVYTPVGELVELKPDSTPIDFAYQVHSEVGMHCIGAKVNDKIVPLNYTLKSGDYVEIITSKNKFPNHSWLKIATTTKAKTHIRRYLKKEKYEQSLRLGYEILEKELRKAKKISLLRDIKKDPTILGFKDYDVLLSNIGNGKIIVSELIDKNLDQHSKENDYNIQNLTSKFVDLARKRSKGIIVDGLSDIMIQFAKCCNPIPGDDIVGYLTKGSGVTIHRSTCKSITHFKDQSRFVSVDWNISSNKSFIVRLKMIFEDRKNLLNDLTDATSKLNIYIKSIDMKAKDSVATCLLVIEISDRKQLEKLVKKMREVQNIEFIERF